MSIALSPSKSYAVLMQQIGDLARAASAYQVPDHWKAKAKCIENLAGLKLHNVVGEPDQADALRYVEDVRDVAKIVDTFVISIGDEAVSSVSNSIDLTLFEDQLSDALEGNAIHSLECAAERIEENRRAA